MNDLAKFVLARADEAAQPTWTLHPYTCPPGHCAPAGWVGTQCRYCDAAPVYGGTVDAMTASAQEHAEQVHQRSHVLADVEVRRQIVYLALGMAESARITGTEDVGGDHILRLLALPDADRPDYRQEWTP